MLRLLCCLAPKPAQDELPKTEEVKDIHIPPSSGPASEAGEKSPHRNSLQLENLNVVRKDLQGQGAVGDTFRGVWFPTDDKSKRVEVAIKSIRFMGRSYDARDKQVCEHMLVR